MAYINKESLKTARMNRVVSDFLAGKELSDLTSYTSPGFVEPPSRGLFKATKRVGNKLYLKNERVRFIIEADKIDGIEVKTGYKHGETLIVKWE